MTQKSNYGTKTLVRDEELYSWQGEDELECSGREEDLPHLSITYVPTEYLDELQARPLGLRDFFRVRPQPDRRDINQSHMHDEMKPLQKIAFRTLEDDLE